MKVRVRVADTATLTRLNQSSVDRGHLRVLAPDLLSRIRPDALHVMWGTFPHEPRTDQQTQLRLVGSAKVQLAESLLFRNGSPKQPHLRTIWLVQVRDGSPVEAVLHLDFQQVNQLPAYSTSWR